MGRLFGTDGARGVASSELTCEFGKADAEVDLLCNELSPVTDGKLVFRPWEIKTVRIK